MPKPKTNEAIAKPSFATYEQRRFDVAFGYDDRESLQIRLEPNNNTVYFSYTENDGRIIHSNTLPFEKFLDVIKEAVHDRSHQT